MENALSQERLNTPENESIVNSSSTPINSSTTEVISETPAEGPTVVPAIEVIPASPVDYDPIEAFNQPTRPTSPTGSTDSSETITPFTYGDPGERPRIAIPRRPFG